MGSLHHALVELRIWFTYRFYCKGVEVHGGITTDPPRREAEHRNDYHCPHGQLIVFGGPMTEAEARAWERANGYT